MKIDGVLIKSDNALWAESKGRFALGELCQQLRIPTEIVEDLPWDGEWHHVSAFANCVRYYDLKVVEGWLSTPAGQEALGRAKAARRAKADASRVLEIPATRARWFEPTTVWRNGRPRKGVPQLVVVDVLCVRAHPDKEFAEMILEEGSLRKRRSKVTVLLGDEWRELPLVVASMLGGACG